VKEDFKAWQNKSRLSIATETANICLTDNQLIFNYQFQGHSVGFSYQPDDITTLHKATAADTYTVLLISSQVSVE
jgi:hypothetical protein